MQQSQLSYTAILFHQEWLHLLPQCPQKEQRNMSTRSKQEDEFEKKDSSSRASRRERYRQRKSSLCVSRRRPKNFLPCPCFRRRNQDASDENPDFNCSLSFRAANHVRQLDVIETDFVRLHFAFGESTPGTGGKAECFLLFRLFASVD